MRSRVTATRPPALRATTRDEGPEANDFFVRASDLCESSSERGTFGGSGAASRVRLPRTFGAHAGDNCLAGRVRSVVRQLFPRVQRALLSIFFFDTSKVFLDALRRQSSGRMPAVERVSAARCRVLDSKTCSEIHTSRRRRREACLWRRLLTWACLASTAEKPLFPRGGQMKKKTKTRS